MISKQLKMQLFIFKFSVFTKKNKQKKKNKEKQKIFFRFLNIYNTTAKINAAISVGCAAHHSFCAFILFSVTA